MACDVHRFVTAKKRRRNSLIPWKGLQILTFNSRVDRHAVNIRAEFPIVCTARNGLDRNRTSASGGVHRNEAKRASVGAHSGGVASDIEAGSSIQSGGRTDGESNDGQSLFIATRIIRNLKN